MFISLKKTFFFVFPFTSFLVLPFIQGTTPAFLLCLLFFFSMPALIKDFQCRSFYKIIFFLLFVIFLLVALAQVGVFFTNVHKLDNLPLVNTENPEQLFLRSSIFTQLIYFFTAIIAFAFVTTFFEKEDLNVIFWGIRLLIIYGLLEWSVFLVTGNEFDFISNRTFNDGGLASSGSLFQSIIIGGVQLQRMKSLTGEPSMFAFTLLPFWILAIEMKRRTDVVLTTTGLILSLSTTAVLGFCFFGLYKVVTTNFRNKIRLITLLSLLMILLFAYFGETFKIIWEEMVVNKLSAESVSGQDRFGNYYSGIAYWQNSNLWIKFFGLGFGIIRSTDFFTTILINGGLSGVLFWLILFFAPFLFVPYSKHSNDIRKMLPVILIIFLTLFLSVPEYMYLSIWVPLGIAYNSIKKREPLLLS